MSLYGIPEYWVWNQMKQRCYNPKHRDYKYYGGKGIRVCARWQSFTNFITDMGRRPSKKHTLERINSNRNYTPANCCWATRTAQGRNTSRVKLSLRIAQKIRLAHRKGEKLSALAKQYGVRHEYLCRLINNETWKPQEKLL